MPLYMDRHDVSPTVTAENVAQLHREDLKIQHLFGCRVLTYWFDEKRKTAFCLIEAPDVKAIERMHAKAHGQVPNQIIEVKEGIVESFLGRIEDPVKSGDAGLNTIDESAFRTIMVIKLVKNNLMEVSERYTGSLLEKMGKEIRGILKNSKGGIVKQNACYFLISFQSVTLAMDAAWKIYSLAKKPGRNGLTIQMGLSASAPLNGQGTIFEDAIRLADQLCEVNHDKIMISSEVKDLYNSESAGSIDEKGSPFFSFAPTDEKLFLQLMNYMEISYSNAYLTVHDFTRSLGLSKSKLYRKMVILTGKSLNLFIKEYRLNKAMDLLHKNLYTISEIAYETGFTGLSYFSKCFQKKYKKMPSAFKHS